MDRGNRHTALTGSSEYVVRVEELGELIRKKRRADRLTLERASEQSGVSAATLSRLERQSEVESADSQRRPRPQPDTRTLAAITRWLDIPVDRVMDTLPPRPAHLIVHSAEETVPDMLDAHLRADPNLDATTAAALGRMFRVAYEQFSQLPPTAQEELPKTEPETKEPEEARSSRHGRDQRR